MRFMATERTYGNLKDEDRIFTNLYGEHDVGIKGAMKRVRLPPHFPYPLPPSLISCLCFRSHSSPWPPLGSLSRSVSPSLSLSLSLSSLSL